MSGISQHYFPILINIFPFFGDMNGLNPQLHISVIPFNTNWLVSKTILNQSKTDTRLQGTEEK